MTPTPIFPDAKQTNAKSAGPTPPSVLFQGVDTFTGSARSTAVVGTSTQVGGEEICTYTTCTNVKSLTKSLQINGDLSASSVFGSIDAKTKYVHNLDLTSTSVVVAVYVNNVAATNAYTNVGLAQGVTIPKHINDFYLGYGDSFVSEITVGAEYIATYVFYSESAEDQTSVVNALSAKGVGAGGSITVSLDTAIQTVRNQMTVRFAFAQTILGLTGVPLPTEENLYQFALAFAARTPNPGMVINFKTTGYEHVPGVGNALDPIVKVRLAFTGGINGDGISANYASLTGLDHATQWILDVYKTYGYGGDKDLTERGKKISLDRESLGNVIIAISKDATVLPKVPPLPSLEWGTPVLNFSTPGAAMVWPSSTSPGPSYFADVGYRDVLSQTKLTSVSIGGVTVSSIGGTVEDVSMISTTYASAEGSKTFTRGGNVQVWGSTWSQTMPFEFQLTDQVASMSGTEENANSIYPFERFVLSSFAITRLSQGVPAHSRWPQAQVGDPQGATWTPAVGEVFVGFCGTTSPDGGVNGGSVLVTLSPLTTTFSPASWSPTPSQQA
ncbi:hypothetical protein [Rhodoferax sp. GW822-FHT02A01]|uniref:hypothetical protein n=1 Tax=Rhodoferax sp. GW822-FHT02A01 TaxID=3141537 RepID=UPI00315C6195